MSPNFTGSAHTWLLHQKASPEGLAPQQRAGVLHIKNLPRTAIYMKT